MTAETIAALLWGFQHFFHVDKANACMHVAPVKFSPITFALARVVSQNATISGRLEDEIAEVLSHEGSYEPDPGR